MSKAKYYALLDRLMKLHPWLIGHLLEPAPGHLETLRYAAYLLKQVLPPEDRIRLTRMHIRSDQGLRIEISPFSGDSRNALIHAIERLALQLSLNRCEVCGQSPTGPGMNNRCSTHQGTISWFAEDLKQMEVQPQENAPTTSSAPEPEIPVIDDAGSRIALFCPKELERYVNNRRRKGAEPAKEAMALEKRVLEAGGPTRPLGLLAPGWEAVLDGFEQSFPNFAELAELLRDHFSLSALGDGRVKWPPVLLVGPPGVGKTEVARFLSNAFGLPFRVFDMASAQSGSALAGSEAFWSNSQPGRLFELLAYERQANPVAVLDELDKVSENRQHSPSGALYTLLEPASAREFRELALDMQLDASHINWVGTANNLHEIPEPIRSRMTVLEIPLPTRAQTVTIARSIYQRIRSQAPWGAAFPEQLDDSVAERLAEYPPRTLFQHLQRTMGAAARQKRTILRPEDVPESSMTASRGIGFMA